MRASIGAARISSRWVGKQTLAVALHFKARRREVNQARLEALAGRAAEIALGVAYPLEATMWAKRWASVEFKLPLATAEPLAVVPEAVRIMQVLIERTWPSVEALLALPADI